MKKVKFETSLGSFTVELNEEKAPETCKNFLTYVKEGFYDGTVFHRVIKGFMIQGGGLTKDFTEKETHDPIKNEASNGLKNEKFTIAMARTPDPHSATAQFFINTVDNAYLDFRSETRDGWGYRGNRHRRENREGEDRKRQLLHARRAHRDSRDHKRQGS